MKKPAVPVLSGYETRKPGLLQIAWCEHCHRWHTHSRGDGFRKAHCEAGPYKTSGYTLKTVGPATRSMLADYGLQSKGHRAIGIGGGKK